MINDKNIFAHELVGLQARIGESSDRSLIGLSGMIVLETKNMITMNTGTGVKHISKLVARKIQLCLPSGSCFINGSSLIGRPEDRVTTLY
jgi:ribonuclease P protein subunit POP4